MFLIRSTIFYIVICISIILVPIIALLIPVANHSSKLADQIGEIWVKFVIWILKILCKVTYQIKGLENLPKSGGFIVACKHQSMWETIIMYLVFNRPVYTYKKELLKIPFYGWFVGRMSGIAIDRKGGSKALKNLLSNSKKYLDQERVIILFPQGTRTLVGVSTQDHPYQSGITAFYSKLKVPIIPAALNSGIYWNKKGFINKAGVITLEFLPAINPGLDKKKFLSLLERVIEKKSNQLIPKSILT